MRLLSITTIPIRLIKTLASLLFRAFSIALIPSIAYMITGCAYHQATIYDECFDREVVLKLCDEGSVIGFDYDSSVSNQYSALEQPEGEYIVCIQNDSYTPCTDFAEAREGWTPRHLGSTDDAIALTGRYAHVEPKLLQSLFTDERHLFQARLNGHIIWVSGYSLHKQSIVEGFKDQSDYMFSNSTFHEIGWVDTFKCPNPKAEEHFWTHINALE